MELLYCSFYGQEKGGCEAHWWGLENMRSSLSLWSFYCAKNTTLFHCEIKIYQTLSVFLLKKKNFKEHVYIAFSSSCLLFTK